MDKKEFIELWNVGYEDFEQKAEFAEEMEDNLDNLIQAEIESRMPKQEEIYAESFNSIFRGGFLRGATWLKSRLTE